MQKKNSRLQPKENHVIHNSRGNDKSAKKKFTINVWCKKKNEQNDKRKKKNPQKGKKTAVVTS